MTPQQIIRRPEVERLVGLSRSAIYAAMDRSEFPRPIRLGKRAVGWLLLDIEHWIQERPISTGW